MRVGTYDACNLFGINPILLDGFEYPRQAKIEPGIDQYWVFPSDQIGIAVVYCDVRPGVDKNIFCQFHALIPPKMLLSRLISFMPAQ
jgi:hypothetical protein